jgi:hypothetical protein
MKIRVEEYIRPDGSSPYAEWFDSLDAQAAAKVTTAKLRMELGNTSNVKWFAGIGEYVIDRAKSLHAEYKARKAPPPIDRNAKKRKR